MSAIARILIARGEPRVRFRREESRRSSSSCKGEGARVTIGHDAGNIAGAHTVVVSSAIDRGNPEYVAAQRAGTPTVAARCSRASMHGAGGYRGVRHAWKNHDDRDDARGAAFVRDRRELGAGRDRRLAGNERARRHVAVVRDGSR